MIVFGEFYYNNLPVSYGISFLQTNTLNTNYEIYIYFIFLPELTMGNDPIGDWVVNGFFFLFS